MVATMKPTTTVRIFSVMQVTYSIPTPEPPTQQRLWGPILRAALSRDEWVARTPRPSNPQTRRTLPECLGSRPRNLTSGSVPLTSKTSPEARALLRLPRSAMVTNVNQNRDKEIRKETDWER